MKKFLAFIGKVWYDLLLYICYGYSLYLIAAAKDFQLLKAGCVATVWIMGLIILRIIEIRFKDVDKKIEEEQRSTGIWVFKLLVRIRHLEAQNFDKIVNNTKNNNGEENNRDSGLQKPE